MNPYRDRKAQSWVRDFLSAYYADQRQRVLVFGINPGRFGAGLTGVTFTDPVALADFCHIDNDLPRRRELSSIFIHEAIARFGGPGNFFGRFFLTAVSPLGFTRDGKNANYYDDPALAKAVTPFIERTVEQQLAAGGRRDHAVLLGTGKNHDFFQALNQRRGWFDALHVLEHPRFIMQYRRKRLDEYLTRYLAVFAAVETGA